MNEHEDKLITAFILKEKQDRYRFLLGSSDPKRRGECLNRLNHCKDLNAKYITWWPSHADVAKRLRQEGSPKQVYVMSGTDAIDGTIMLLEDAVNEVSKGGWGTIIS